MKFKDLKVGDEVYLVENDTRHRNPRYVRVSKIGRKFVYISLSEYHNQQRKIVEWNNNGYAIAVSNEYPNCKIYPNKEVYDSMNLWLSAKNLLSGFGGNDKITEGMRNKIVEVLRDIL